MDGIDEQQATWVSLIRGAASGNSDDQSLFARRYLPVVRAYVGNCWRSTPWIVHLEDAVQEVFVQCFREDGALKRFDADRDGGFRAFLFGVIRNVMRRFERDLGRKEAREEAEGSTALRGQPSEDPTQSVVFDRAWAMSIIEQARDRMEQRALLLGAEAHRRLEILRLRFEDDLPVREIASIWGLPPDLVHQEYRRARREFRTCLRQVVAYHSHDGPEDLDAECERLISFLSD